MSQAIGVGGRDLSAAVGGPMMPAGLRALQADPATDVIVLISRPPAPSVAARALAQVKASAKPTVVCFLGADPLPIEAACGFHVTNLTQAAAAAAAIARRERPEDALTQLERESVALIPLAAAEQAKLTADQAALRGLFAGGAFCYEAQLILRNLPEARTGGRIPSAPTTCVSTWARTNSPRAGCIRCWIRRCATGASWTPPVTRPSPLSCL